MPKRGRMKRTEKGRSRSGHTVPCRYSSHGRHVTPNIGREPKLITTTSPFCAGIPSPAPASSRSTPFYPSSFDPLSPARELRARREFGHRPRRRGRPPMYLSRSARRPRESIPPPLYLLRFVSPGVLYFPASKSGRKLGQRAERTAASGRFEGGRCPRTAEARGERPNAGEGSGTKGEEDERSSGRW